MSTKEHYISKLISQGEHQQLDFKFEISDSRKIARSLVAFANSMGGKLLIGVKDNGAIAGIRSDEEKYMVEAAADMFCKPKIQFKSKEWQIEGKTVLEITVPPSEKDICYAKNENGKWLAYHRVDDQTLLVNSTLLKVWKAKKSNKGVKIKYSKTEQVLLSFLKENEFITLTKFSKIARIPRFKAESVLVDFVILEIIDIVFTDKQVFYKLSEDTEKLQ